MYTVCTGVYSAGNVYNVHGLTGYSGGGPAGCVSLRRTIIICLDSGWWCSAMSDNAAGRVLLRPFRVTVDYAVPVDADVTVDGMVDVMGRFARYDATARLDSVNHSARVTVLVDAPDAAGASRAVVDTLRDDPVCGLLTLTGIDVVDARRERPLPPPPRHDDAGDGHVGRFARRVGSGLWLSVVAIILFVVGALLMIGGESTVLLSLSAGICGFALSFVGVTRARSDESIARIILGTVAMTLTVVLTIATGIETVILIALSL